MKFFVITNQDFHFQKVMEMARERSIMYCNSFGANGYCETELIGTVDDYKAFESAIKNEGLNAEIDANEF